MRRRPTHCSRGHELTPENVVDRADGRRECLPCRRFREARRDRSTMTPEERAAARGAGIRAAHARRREALIEEIEFQLEAGSSAKLLPARLGYDKPESLERLLYRAERPDLAVLFGRAA